MLLKGDFKCSVSIGLNRQNSSYHPTSMIIVRYIKKVIKSIGFLRSLMHLRTSDTLYGAKKRIYI